MSRIHTIYEVTNNKILVEVEQSGDTFFVNFRIPELCDYVLAAKDYHGDAKRALTELYLMKSIWYELPSDKRPSMNEYIVGTMKKAASILGNYYTN